MTNNDKEIMATWLRTLAAAIIAILMLLLVCVMCGCRSTRYVPVEHTTLRTDTLYKSIWHTDSIISTDTIRITEDGTEIIKWRWRTKETHDTIYQAKTDSVYVDKIVEVEKVREVERKAFWWETALMWIGGMALVLVILIVYDVVEKKFKRK